MSAQTTNASRDLIAHGKESKPVAASTSILKGIMTCRNAAGYLVPAADTAGLEFEGISTEPADNSSGENGDLRCEVETEDQFIAGGSGFTAADVGKDCYVLNNNDVGLWASSTNKVRAGQIREVVSATEVRVSPRRANLLGLSDKKSLNGGPLADQGAGAAVTVQVLEVRAGRALRLKHVAVRNGTATLATVDVKVDGTSILADPVDLTTDTWTHLTAFTDPEVAAGEVVTLVLTTGASTGDLDAAQWQVDFVERPAAAA